jgi:hypothetical protein
MSVMNNASPRRTQENAKKGKTQQEKSNSTKQGKLVGATEKMLVQHGGIREKTKQQIMRHFALQNV